MIAAWMVWSIGAGLLLLVAGLAAEKLFEGRRRWVWVVAGVGTVLLTAARLFATDAAGPEDPSEGAAISEIISATGANESAASRGMDAVQGTPGGEPWFAFLPVTIPRGSVLHTLDGILLSAWLAVSAGLALWALIGTANLRRRRRSWQPGTLLDQAVLWSRNTGPAIIGLVRPSVVLPTWVNEVEPRQQRLILAHEEEHRRAHDGVLRFAMAALLIAFPWNPSLWLHYRRLVLGIECDCDHRVMRRLPDSRWLYGDLLVRTGARGGMRTGFVPTAFAERRTFLERRIGRLLSEPPEAGMARMAFFAFAAVLAVGVAMWVPGITEEIVLPRQAVQPDESAPLALVEFELGVPQPPVPMPGVPLPSVPLPVIPFREWQEGSPLPQDASVMQRPQYVAHTQLPRLENMWAVDATIETEYPAGLREAGIGGTVVAYLFVNTNGSVSRIVMKTSSGHPDLDRLAFRLARLSRYRPAANEGVPIGMWIEIQVPFTP